MALDRSDGCNLNRVSSGTVIQRAARDRLDGYMYQEKHEEMFKSCFFGPMGRTYLTLNVVSEELTPCRSGCMGQVELTLVVVAEDMKPCCFEFCIN